MPDDFERKFYKELAEIESIKGKISKLRSDYKKLSKRIDQIEIQAHQEQINALNDALLVTQRILARLYIHNEFTNLLKAVQDQRPDIYDRFNTQLVADASALRAQIDTSMNPLPLAQQFLEKCIRYADELRISRLDLS